MSCPNCASLSERVEQNTLLLRKLHFHLLGNCQTDWCEIDKLCGPCKALKLIVEALPARQDSTPAPAKNIEKVNQESAQATCGFEMTPNGAIQIICARAKESTQANEPVSVCADSPLVKEYLDRKMGCYEEPAPTLNVDGLVVGPNMVRAWLEELRALRASNAGDKDE